MSSSNEQAVLVFLRGSGLPDHVYEEFDVATLEDSLIQAIDSAGVGEFDGNEFGPDEVVLYMYGPDAEALWEVIKPIIEAYPLCQGARIQIRPGGPDVSGREVSLSMKS